MARNSNSLRRDVHLVEGSIRVDHSLVVYPLLIGAPFLVTWMAILGIHGTVRGIFAFLAIAFVPGAAVLAYLPRVPTLLRIGVAASISLAIFTIGSFIIAELRLFYSWPLLWLVFIPSIYFLARSHLMRARPMADAIDALPPRRSFAEWREDQKRFRPAAIPRPRGTWIAPATIIFALLLWLISLPQIDPLKMKDTGLLTVLPGTWYLAFFLLVLGGATYAMRGAKNTWVMISFVASLIVVIYATTPLTYEIAHYPWVYKHVGVTTEIMHYGRLFKDADIYNRWPAMFALGGVFSRFAGYADPVNYIAWSELVFIGLQTILVGAIAQRETKNVGTTGLAAMFFVLINWIGQAYFSPQALAFTFQLTILALIFGQLAAQGNRFGGWGMGLLRFFTRKKQTWPLRRQSSDWPTGATISALALIDIAATISHQLTPYIIALQVGLMWFFGFVRPKWIIFLLGAIPVLYLLPMIGWVNEHYGIFSSFDPTGNVKVADQVKLECVAGCARVALVTTLASAFGWLAAFASVLIVARRRPSFRVPFFLLGLIGPFLMVLGQSYGGEAALRLVMFCAPFGAVLIATAISTYGPRLRVFFALGVSFVLAVTFLFAYFGNDQNYMVKKSALRAAEYYYAHARPGSVLIETSPNFPGLVGPNYSRFARNSGGGMVLLWDDPLLRFRPNKCDKRPLGASDIPQLIVDVSRYADYGYFVFSPEQIKNVVSLGLAEPGAIENLEQAMLDSGYFEVWHEAGDTRILRMKKSVDASAKELQDKLEKSTKYKQSLQDQGVALQVLGTFFQPLRGKAASKVLKSGPTGATGATAAAAASTAPVVEGDGDGDGCADSAIDKSLYGY
jgi:hypothetical protein